MTIFRFIFVLLICTVVSSCASIQRKQTESEDVPTPFSAHGWGGATCKELIHDITPENVGFQQAVQNIRLYQSWASGFVSGVNYSDNNVYDVSGATSPEDTFIWLKEFCSENNATAIPLALHELLEIWKNEGKVIHKAK